MRKDTTSRVEVKQFADRITKRLMSDGVDVPYTLMLEGMAAGFEERDWNTLSALLKKGEPKPVHPVSVRALASTALEWCSAANGAFGPIGQMSPFYFDSLSTYDSHLEGRSPSLVLAAPGKGKTTLLGLMAMDFCMHPPAAGTLPVRLGVVDVGKALTGVAQTIRSRLPANRRWEVQGHSLRWDKSQRVNMLDTPLGCRRPQGLEAAEILHFVSLVATPPDETKPSDILVEVAHNAVEAAYDLLSDRVHGSRPRAYVRGVEPRVDGALLSLGVALEDMTWWTCVDVLTENGFMGEAVLAQRHAVPLLQDVLDASRSPRCSMYEDAFCGDTREPLLLMFQREISSTLRLMPNIQGPTNLDMGNARIAVVDISECTSMPLGPLQCKQASVAFMLARRLVAGNMFTHELSMEHAPALYHKHHDAILASNRRTPMLLIYDEFHRYGTCSRHAGYSARFPGYQVAMDMREGVKWGVQVTVSSQTLTSFTDGMVAAHRSLWLMGGGTLSDQEDISKRFGLDVPTRNALGHALTGPAKEGTPSLLVFRDAGGRGEIFVHVLRTAERWRLSSSTDDMALRDSLAAKIGFSEAIRRLSIRYPKGHAWKDLGGIKLEDKVREIERISETLAQEIG